MNVATQFIAWTVAKNEPSRRVRSEARYTTCSSQRSRNVPFGPIMPVLTGWVGYFGVLQRAPKFAPTPLEDEDDDDYEDEVGALRRRFGRVTRDKYRHRDPKISLALY